MRALEWLLEQPLVYSTWQAPFAEQKLEPLVRHMQRHAVRRVLDVGCGPGTNTKCFAEAEYVGIDINEAYLAHARRSHRGTFIAADLRTAALSDWGAFDTIIVNSVLHHLDDASVERILERLSQSLTAEGRVHVMELVLPAHLSRARLMARLDRGRYARSIAHWSGLFERHLECVVAEPYTFGGGWWQMVYLQGRRQ
jgi:trans-aconitate methyltransferase